MNEIPAEELTVTFMREAYPRELFKILGNMGVKITEKYKGIYYLSGNTTFDTQIIVTKQLDENKHAGLRILSKKAKEEDVRNFLTEAGLAKEPGDLQNIDAMLQVSVAENAKLYEKVRRDKVMCEALKDLMKEEIAEERAEASAEASAKTKAETIVDNVKSLMKNMKWTAKQAMEALGISEADQSKYSALL